MKIGDTVEIEEDDCRYLVKIQKIRNTDHGPAIEGPFSVIEDRADIATFYLKDIQNIKLREEA